MFDPVDPLVTVDECSPIFHGLGASDRGSIPIGNGELCANVWVESDGLHFYLARSDALSELDRTLKLGEFVVGAVPNPFDQASRITQALQLRSGLIEVVVAGDQGDVHIEFFIDAQENDAFVRFRSDVDRDVWVELRQWRTEANSVTASASMFWGDEDQSGAPGLAEVKESADVVESLPDGVLCYHANGATIVPHIISLHGLDSAAEAVPDLLTGRIFGTFLCTDRPAEVVGPRLTVRRARSVNARVSTFSSQTGRPALHVSEARRRPINLDECRERTAEFWIDYWRRSWIVVRGDSGGQAAMTDEVRKASQGNSLPKLTTTAASAVTQAYVLSKWMNACGSRGAMPIRYNGALFTTMPGGGKHLALELFGETFTAEPLGDPTIHLNPDERSWTIEHLWQNLRLPYYTLLAQGDPDALLPLFAYFRRFWGVNRARARLHYQARGQWNTEMTLSCGLQSPGIYGLDRSDVPAGYAKNRWGGAINLSPGLELCKLQFDYWRFTADDVFLEREVLPYAQDLIDFALSFYGNSEGAQIEFGPLNSLETYFDTTNPVAVVAGFHRLLQDLLGLPAHIPIDRRSLESFRDALPAIPTETDSFGQTSIAPASHYEARRMNVENPELYCVFPFDLRSSIGSDLLLRTWDKCLEKSGVFRPRVIGEELGAPCFAGWQYMGPVAALLGRLDLAAHALESNAALSNPGFAFPAMWGPVYDAVPDTDHGANIVNTLQAIVLQSVSDPDSRLRLPSDWTIDFKLFQPNGSAVQGTVTHESMRLFAL